MVDLRGPRSDAMRRALPAEWLYDQLVRPPLCPAIPWVDIQVMPCGGFFLLWLWFWFMLWAVSVRSQHSASRLLTTAQRLKHGVTSRRKQKEPASRIASQRNMAQALRRRLLVWDIHDRLGVAGLAVYRKIFNPRGRKDAHDALSVAGRADEPSPDYLYFITRRNICQCVSFGFHPFITYYSKVNIDSQGRKFNKRLRSLA